MQRSLLYLCLALLAAVGIYFLERPDQPLIRQSSTQPYAQLTLSQVARLEIEQLMDGVVLVRDGTAWVARSLTPALKQQADATAHVAQGGATAAPVTAPAAVEGTENLPVDATLLAQAMDALARIQLTSPVSRNPENHAKLQVGPLALQVRAKDADGTELAKMWIGKTGPDYFSSYLRIGEQPDVYLTDAPLRGQFPVRLANWRDKQLWSIDADTQLQRVERTGGSAGSVVLTKGDDGALRVAGQEDATLDHARVQEWLARWTSLKAVEFPERIDLKKAGLDQPSGRLTVTLKDGATKTLLIGGNSPGGLPYGKLEGDAPIVVLPSTMTATLNADWQEWVAKAPGADHTAEAHAK